MRRITFAEGRHLVATGRATSRMEGALQCFQLLPPMSSVIVPAEISRAALGVSEMRANAGLLGKSRTVGMRELDRAGRRNPRNGEPLPLEDFVERVQNLMKTYPHSANFRDLELARKGKLHRPLAPGGDRAVRVYPKAPAP